MSDTHCSHTEVPGDALAAFLELELLVVEILLDGLNSLGWSWRGLANGGSA